MNWFKNNKSKNLSIDNVTLAKHGLYFNIEANNNLKLNHFKFAQVALIEDKIFCVQFTMHRVNNATNYKIFTTRNNAVKLNCVQFVNRYFNAYDGIKYAKSKVKERDNEHLLIECKLEEEYNGTV